MPYPLDHRRMESWPWGRSVGFDKVRVIFPHGKREKEGISLPKVSEFVCLLLHAFHHCLLWAELCPPKMHMLKP